MKAIAEIISSIFWLIKRWLTRKDANEPQEILDQARTDSATGNDAALNSDLDAAADRLRNQNHRP